MALTEPSSTRALPQESLWPVEKGGRKRANTLLSTGLNMASGFASLGSRRYAGYSVQGRAISPPNGSGTVAYVTFPQ